jgi:hypothetical protein
MICAVRERLYAARLRAEQLRNWKNYVQPDLRDLFRSSQEVVRAALEGFPPDNATENYTLRIPVKNLEAWINVLNQARLALSARHNFTEKDMEVGIPIESDTRALALFQVHFYGFLQECFLRQLED